MLAILLIGRIALILWVISPQISNIATISLVLLIILFKFIVEGIDLLMLLYLFIILSIVVLSQYAYK